MDPATCSDWANFCRQVCIDSVITQVRPIGGPVKIVEIDESLFSKKIQPRHAPAGAVGFWRSRERIRALFHGAREEKRCTDVVANNTRIYLA